MNIPRIPDAFTSIQTSCTQKINERFPHGIPAIVQERLNAELQYLKNSEYLDDFEIYRQICMEAQKCCQYFTVKGTLGGSYLIYLMGVGRFNPLPAHYYCEACGHFETVSTHLFGIDLPERTCPNCGTPMFGDGFNLSIESVWGTNGKKLLSFDYNVSDEFRPFVKNILHRLYPENVILPCGIMTAPADAATYNPGSLEVVHSGFFILPEYHTLEDYTEMKSYLEDGEPCLSGHLLECEENSLKRITLLPLHIVEQLIGLQRNTGTYIWEIDLKKLREITYHDMMNSRMLNPDEDLCYSCKKPKTYFEMIKYNGIFQNSFRDTNCCTAGPYNEIDKLIFKSPEYERYPCATREDFFDYLLESGNSREDAYKISELIRKGRALNYPGFDDFKMPIELNTLAKKYTYILPRAQVIEYTLMNARMAHYMKLDSKAYSKIVFKGKKVSSTLQLPCPSILRG